MRKGRAVLVAAVMMGVALAGFGWAQQGGAGNGAQNGSGPLVDVSRPVTVQGAVVAFLAGVGQGVPELVVRDASGTEWAFVLGPYWFLQSQTFVAQAGDEVTVNGYACGSCEHGVAVASVVNVTRSLTLTLRSADGTPAWIGQAGTGLRRHVANGAHGSCAMHDRTAGLGAGLGQGTEMGGGHRMCQGPGPDLSRVATFEGAVTSFTGGPGQGLPTLALATAQGEASIVLSPYLVMLQAGYAPAAGARLSVTAAPVDVDGVEHWVAITLTDLGSGLTLQFRNPETGLPAVAGHGPWH